MIPIKMDLREAVSPHMLATAVTEALSVYKAKRFQPAARITFRGGGMFTSLSISSC
jgi:hypothetical protein